MALDLSKFKVSKKVRYFNGKSEITVSDFIDGEVITISIIDTDGVKSTERVAFSQELIDLVQSALNENSIKSATVFKS